MPRKRIECESSIYHVMARSCRRQTIFEDSDDRRFFLFHLKTLMSFPIYAWRLNHYRLAVQIPIESLSPTMQQLTLQYDVWLNARHNHMGHVFQQRFKSEPIDTNSYFLSAIRYAYQNPVKAEESKRFIDLEIVRNRTRSLSGEESIERTLSLYSRDYLRSLKSLDKTSRNKQSLHSKSQNSLSS